MGGSPQKPENRKGHLLPGMSYVLGKASICPNLKLGMRHENKIKLAADLVCIQWKLQSPSYLGFYSFEVAFIFFFFFNLFF